MRLGGPISAADDDPNEWVAALRAAGYAAAYCPVGDDADEDVVGAYRQAAKAADIVIAEVGAWSNPISPNENVRQASVAQCQRRLALAEQIGARCCVNIAGSRCEQEDERPTSPGWSWPHPDNLSADTFAMIVDSVREIIDAVKPERTAYTLETMPWVFPDSADSYLRLIEAIDRPAFGVHLDPVNLVNCPQRYYDSTALLRECFAKLGPHIKSCHAKDIALETQLTVHLNEVRPGVGGLDYHTYLRELAKLEPDTPLMLEHLPAEEYPAAAAHVRAVAEEVGVAFR